MPGLKSQFPEQMGVAEGMAAFEFRTALEAVVHEDVLETGQEPQSLEGEGAPFGVRRKPAERFRDQDMEPMETSPRPDPGLVRPRNGLPQQGFGNLPVRRFQAAARFPDQFITVPVEGWTPHQASSSSPVRLAGSIWCWVRQTTSALKRGPYCTGA